MCLDRGEEAKEYMVIREAVEKAGKKGTPDDECVWTEEQEFQCDVVVRETV